MISNMEINQVSVRDEAMAYNKDMVEAIERARAIAAENGGILPSVTWLHDNGHRSVAKAIRADRAPFESMLAKMGRGRDKRKYAYVRANMDVDDVKLAKDLDLSRATIKSWKAEIRESRFVEPDPSSVPDDVGAEDVARFIIRNLPHGWALDVSHDSHGCYVSLVQPNGMRREVETACDVGLVPSVVIHVNQARKEAGLEPVGWED